MPIGVYIDGFNLYHSIDALDQPELKWLSLSALAASFVRQGESVAVVRYFTAVQDSFPSKAQRHRRYIDALKATGVEVHLSRFQKATKFCVSKGGGCAFHEEKQTDVKICSSVLADAYEDTVDRVVLVTADSDQVPTVEALKRLGRPVTIAAPPGRLTVARELGQKADEIFEIKPGRLAACVLPRNVYEAGSNRFVAARPAEYGG